MRRVEAENVRLDGYQRRYPGFLAERLHGWWLEQRAREGLRVGEVGVAIVDAAGITNSGVLHGGPGWPSTAVPGWRPSRRGAPSDGWRDGLVDAEVAHRGHWSYC